MFAKTIFFFFKGRSRSAGFTMLEMIVVIFLITFLSAGVLFNYQNAKKKYALAQEVQEAVSNFRKAQNMAISGTGIYGNYYGYGLYFNPAVSDKSYFLYGDLDNDNGYDAGEEIETINLGQFVEIQATYPLADLDVFFLSPDPATYINGSSMTGQVGGVTLEILGGVQARQINVSTAGRIGAN